MLTATRPSSKDLTVVMRPAATPPATTVPTSASVATHMWCLCSRLTRLAPVPKERFSTIPPVSSSRFRRFEDSEPLWDRFSFLPCHDQYMCILVCHLCFLVPCCPEGVSISVVSADTLEIIWMASRGAELYETRAADSSEVVLCNDTAPVCALSDLSCDSTYSVAVTPCNEIRGCNRACKAYTKDTGTQLLFILYIHVSNKYPVTVHFALLSLLQSHCNDMFSHKTDL